LRKIAKSRYYSPFFFAYFARIYELECCFLFNIIAISDRAAQLLSYNTDGKFKPELKEEKTIGACTVSLWLLHLFPPN
jgi:hypothetical protein